MSQPQCAQGTGGEGVYRDFAEAASSRLPGLVTRPLTIHWPCRNCYSGSLYALPPELCRRDVFCRGCTANTCLFGGTPAERRTRQAQQHWAMPDEAGLDLYIDALRLYTGLLGKGRTCWHCTGLRLLQGKEPRYVCPYNLRLVGPQPVLRAPLPSLDGDEARLLTALEACRGEHFAPRSAPIPTLLAAHWRDMLTGADLRGRCDLCVHLRSLAVAGRERYVCAIEAERQPGGLAWRLARSLRVIQSRGGRGAWCHGAEWRLRASAVPPLAVSAATA